ncbi:hypothetical protein HOK51_02000 [Candidatus Woesearchaeota archaeon]|nr:hypothetical protein [Candidatus Woesearchaeota archaeon]MBT6518588.1 hypothetical protein [Candidatus Woesearchaeota archaeon]MBT7367453.1 hypothetical protein [Candidatus Woesearchaeota archaeon]
MKKKIKKCLIVLSIVLLLVLLYGITKLIPPDFLSLLSMQLPLPIFTFLIALVDGFNPCNLFVLTLLISLMLSESHSREKIFAVGYSFIFVVYIFYFLFMAAWLNIFKYIGFIDPLRIAIASIAIIAGLINCKEYFFYRRGITLMVQDKHVKPLIKRIQSVAKLLKKGSMPTLIGASVVLAIFASLVELPCTAGFPIIYTGVLIGMSLRGISYYLYLALYNLVYVLPLVTIITLLGYTFNGKQIEKTTMALIKFIGGAIMLILGAILILSPGLIGL